jgi:RHS repeat-associated protein
VRQVDYQKDQPDALHHRYTYDADNRITEVETSADAQNWHHDARYFYSRPEPGRRDPHGPLQRVELGEHLVQGTDYAYTLQGWLKGINGDRLNPTTDMGRDGDATVVGNPNLLTGRDAYALSLGYYGDGDYKAIASAYDSDTPANVVQRPFAPIGTSGTLNTEHTPLYNGNIAHTVNTLQHFGLWDATNGDQGQVLAMVYRYDQLNRLRTARGLVGLGNTNTWDGVNDAVTNRYRSEYTYDANGNIETVQRYDGAGTGHYDSFAYHYYTSGGRKQQNRLYELIDAATMNTGSDIVTTATGFDNSPNGVNANNNYGYDALGNLVRDDREDIELIHWTVAGKVDSIQRPGTSSRSPLKFRYGASGQRVSKQVGDFYATDPGAYREHYIRDAQGNIMATYRYTNNDGASLKLNERPVYGSSRLGSLREEVELHTLPSFDPATANPVQMVDLNYELTDHLGNVCAVVTGRLLDGNGGGTAKQAELVSAQGYEPFGSLLPGRNYSSDAYRFGFQGQEQDNEVHDAPGTSVNYKYRMHDPRIGRFLSIDPLAADYPHNSPYAFSENRVIDAIELEGAEKLIIIGNADLGIKQTFSIPNAGLLGQGVLTASYSVHTGLLLFYSAAEGDATGSGFVNPELLLADNTVAGPFLNKWTFLPSDLKENLFIDGMNYSRNEAAMTAARYIADGMETAGDAIELGGVAVSMVPLGQPVGGAMIATGAGVSNLGLAVNLSLDVIESDYEKAMNRVLINSASLGFGSLTRGITKAGMKSDKSSEFMFDATNTTLQGMYKILENKAEDHILQDRQEFVTPK